MNGLDAPRQTCPELLVDPGVHLKGARSKSVLIRRRAQSPRPLEFPTSCEMTLVCRLDYGEQLCVRWVHCAEWAPLILSG